MNNTKVVILGASPNPIRVSYTAANILASKNYHIFPLGLKKGEVAGIPILDLRTRPWIEDVHTITLYMNPRNQEPFYEYILGLKPKRVIFNPGTENQVLINRLQKVNIEVTIDCTLVMLSAGYFEI